MTEGQTTTVVGEFAQLGLLQVAVSPAGLPVTVFIDGVARDDLCTFTARYLGVFGAAFAAAMAAETRISSVPALHEVLDGAESAGCDELVLVPGTVDLDCLDRTAAALVDR